MQGKEMMMGGMGHEGEEMMMKMMLFKNLNPEQQKILMLRALDLKIRKKELKINFMQENLRLMQEKLNIMRMARDMLASGGWGRY